MRPLSLRPPGWLAVAIVFAAGLGITAGTSSWLEKAEDAEARAELDSAIDIFFSRTQERLRSNTQLVHSLAGMKRLLGNVNKPMLGSYMSELDIRVQYPGFLAIGYVERTTSASELESRMRKEGMADYAVRWPITYVEPAAALRRVGPGFDLASDPGLRALLEAARDSGDVAGSSHADELLGVPPGFILVHPLYAGGALPGDVAQRRRLIAGFVFVLFDAENLMNDLATQLPVGVAGRLLVDLSRRDSERVLYDSLPQAARLRSTATRQEIESIGGELTILEAAPTAAFAGVTDRDRSRLVLALGSLATLMMATIVWLFATRGDWAESRATQMAASLNEALKRFRDLSQMASDWFWEQDENYRFTSFSESERHEEHDVKPSFALGKTRWEMAAEPDSPPMLAFRAMVEAHLPYRDFEYGVRYDDGTVHWLSVNGKPLFDAAGRFVGYRGTTREITARKRLEEELRAHRDNLRALVEVQTADLLTAKEAAEKASHSKSEFLANMSHELRTPMHAILSFARIGHDRAVSLPPEKLREYFGRIQTSGERLLELVNDLLDLSKLEAGKMPVQYQLVDVAQLAQEVAHDLEAMIEARHLRVEFPSPGCDPFVEGDAARLAQVVRNLLSNALKFTPAGRCVTVEFADAELPAGRRAQDQGMLTALRMTVADEGIGIPATELDTVFSKFFQSSKTRTGAGGTGLGLAICREIVAAHRGTISARNRPEGGTAFDTILPRETRS